MQSLVEDFRALKLHGMAEALPDILAKPRASGNSLDTVLRKLVRSEQADRQVRSLQYQMKSARFPQPRDLAGFDFAESPLEEEHLHHLAAGEFTGLAHNLILIGGTGTGKTHLSIALSSAQVHLGKRVRFFRKNWVHSGACIAATVSWQSFRNSS